MVEEVGIVVEQISVGIVRVLCQKSSACQHCASMEACSLGEDNRSRVVEAHNPIGAKVGDRVRLSINAKTLLQSSFIVYIVPLIALIIGALTGESIGRYLVDGPDPNLLAALFGVAFLVGAFLVIKVGSRALPKESYLPRIVGLVSTEENFVAGLDHGN